MSDDELGAAVADIIALHATVWTDIGPALTCTEVNAVARLLTAVGATEQAATLIEGHALADNDCAGDDPSHRELAARLAAAEDETL